MKRFIFMTILFTSCSVFRHKTENSSSQRDLTVHAVQHKDSLQLSARSQRIRFLSHAQLALTEIIPSGVFVYKPDTGFTGEAKSIRIYRQTWQRSLEKDTSSLRLSGGSDRIQTDSTVREQARQQLEETMKSKPVPVWIYVLAAAILLLAINFARRKG